MLSNIDRVDVSVFKYIMDRRLLMSQSYYVESIIIGFDLKIIQPINYFWKDDLDISDYRLHQK